MLELKELKYILTTEDGKMIAGYNNLKDAETDADDLCTSKKNKKFRIFEIKNSTSLTDSIVQKTYELTKTYPLPEPEPEPEKKPEEGQEKDGAKVGEADKDKKE